MWGWLERWRAMPQSGLPAGMSVPDTEPRPDLLVAAGRGDMPAMPGGRSLSIPIQDEASAALREAELRRLHALDSHGAAAYQYIVHTASRICETPLAMIGLVDRDWLWVKASIGMPGDRAPLDNAFCAHVLEAGANLLVVPDTLEDPRFADNALVLRAPGLRFYVGAPLVTSRGVVLGTVCVADFSPREPTPVQLETLRLLAHQTVGLLELRAARGEEPLATQGEPPLDAPSGGEAPGALPH